MEAHSDKRLTQTVAAEPLVRMITTSGGLPDETRRGFSSLFVITPRRYGSMARETINGTFRQTNLPNESGEYLTKREDLRIAEIELMRQSARVAELRRQLPKGAIVQDYMFEEGPANLDEGDTPTRTVRLSDLFTGPDRS